MVEEPCPIVWTKPARRHLKQIYQYIAQDSPQNALMVTEALVAGMEKAQDNPERYSPDKYKKENDGSYRAFELHHYRLSYRYERTVIRVLRIRHTSMQPLYF